MRTCAISVCFLALVVLIHSLPEEARQKIKNVHSECQSNPATHVDEAILKKLHSGEKVDKSVVGAHILCMSTKLGLLTEDGKVDRANLRKGLSRAITDETKLDETVNKCAVNKDNAQDTALDLLKCFRENTDQDLHGDHHH